MIAPYDIEVISREQVIHDDVGTRTSIEDVAQDMQLVDAEPLNHFADGCDEVLTLPRLDDGFDDSLEIGLFVVIFWILVHKLLDDIGKLAG